MKITKNKPLGGNFMKKRVLALLLSIALVFSLCVAVSAISEQDVFVDDTVGVIGSEDGETAILYGDDSIYTDDYTASIEDLEYMFSQFGEENVPVLIATVVAIMVSSLLFLPALILLIVFAVLNSKLKKKIIECETRINVMQEQQNAPQAEPQPTSYTVAPQSEPQGTEPAPAEAPVDDKNEGGEE
jgi:hypothetical protein